MKAALKECVRAQASAREREGVRGGGTGRKKAYARSLKRTATVSIYILKKYGMIILNLLLAYRPLGPCYTVHLVPTYEDCTRANT